MDPIKKRKLDENGAAAALTEPDPVTRLTHQDARKLLERFSNDQLLDILQDAVSRHMDVLNTVRSIGDRDPAQRKLFIRGLGWETTTDGLRSLFSEYGELQEAVVVLDKVTGKSKGYGFVIFKHVDGALLALKEPSKQIDGRVTVTQLAAAGNSGSTQKPKPNFSPIRLPRESVIDRVRHLHFRGSVILSVIFIFADLEDDGCANTFMTSWMMDEQISRKEQVLYFK